MTFKIAHFTESTGFFLFQFSTKNLSNFKAKCVHAVLKCQRRQFLSGEKLMDFLESIFCLAGWAATRIGREVKSASNPLVDGDFHIAAVESVDLEASLNLMTKPAGGPIMTVSQYAQLQ